MLEEQRFGLSGSEMRLTLRRVTATRVLGRDEWRTYVSELIARHQRKYKLRPMLEDLAK